MMDRADKDVLSADEVAAQLGVQPATVYRWCREGLLPCVKLGKVWRIHRGALDAFLRRGQERRTLVGHLSSFLDVPDFVIAIAETEELLYRLDAAFFRVGEMRGAQLVKFYTGENARIERLRSKFMQHGLDAGRLEAEGRLRFVEEADTLAGRLEHVRWLHDEVGREGGMVWASFDWVTEVDLEEAFRQQERLGEIIDIDHLVVLLNVLERIMDQWRLEEQRRARQAHRSAIWISQSGLFMGRIAPLPSV